VSTSRIRQNDFLHFFQVFPLKPSVFDELLQNGHLNVQAVLRLVEDCGVRSLEHRSVISSPRWAEGSASRSPLDPQAAAAPRRRSTLKAASRFRDSASCPCWSRHPCKERRLPRRIRGVADDPTSPRPSLSASFRTAGSGSYPSGMRSAGRNRGRGPPRPTNWPRCCRRDERDRIFLTSSPAPPRSSGRRGSARVVAVGQPVDHGRSRPRRAPPPFVANVRIITASAYRERTRAVSRIGSPRPICVSCGTGRARGRPAGSSPPRTKPVRSTPSGRSSQATSPRAGGRPRRSSAALPRHAGPDQGEDLLAGKVQDPEQVPLHAFHPSTGRAAERISSARSISPSVTVRGGGTSGCFRRAFTTRPASRHFAAIGFVSHAISAPP